MMAAMTNFIDPLPYVHTSVSMRYTDLSNAQYFTGEKEPGNLFIYRPRLTSESFLIEQWLRHQGIDVDFSLTVDGTPVEYFEAVYAAADARLYDSVLAYRSSLESLSMHQQLLQEAINSDNISRARREELVTERTRAVAKGRASFEVIRAAVVTNRFLEAAARAACRAMAEGETLAVVLERIKFYSRLMQSVTVRVN